MIIWIIITAIHPLPCAAFLCPLVPLYFATPSEMASGYERIETGASWLGPQGVRGPTDEWWPKGAWNQRERRGKRREDETRKAGNCSEDQLYTKPGSLRSSRLNWKIKQGVGPDLSIYTHLHIYCTHFFLLCHIIYFNKSGAIAAHPLTDFHFNAISTFLWL